MNKTSLSSCFGIQLSRISKYLSHVLLLGGLNLPVSINAASPETDFLELSLEELLSVTVTSASGTEERLRDASASMIVITAKDIKKRAYTDLGQVLSDLPGFDIVKSHSHDKTIAYQRGYRTPTNQRTLFMFNGVINNLLWSQEFSVNNQVPLKNVERIEVLYGPAGAIYGPNAFSGIVNIITRDAKKLAHGESYFDYNIQAHSYETVALDIAAGGRFEDLSYSVAAKLYNSEGPDLSDFPQWGFLRSEYLSDRNIWGPVLDHENQNRPYGEFYSPDKEEALIAEFNWANLTLGLNYYQTSNGYGLKFPLDKGNPNAQWSKRSSQVYLRHKRELSAELSVSTFAKYNTNRRWGDWVEATDDWRAGMEGYSFVSISNWNNVNSAWKFRQDWQYQATEQIRVLAGVKYESKDLTKAYDVCGYWSASFCSSTAGENLGPEGFGEGVYHTTSTEPLPLFPGPLATMPNANVINTNDKGAYLQATWDNDIWIYSAAIRYDRNSEYGSFIKPRLSAIYHMSERSTLKFIYSTAFQEPGPIQLYGGWNGRRANPDLKPEEITNYEAIWLFQDENWSHDLSIYYADYENVIKEQAENAGERDVTGFEYRGRIQFDNFISDGSAIEGYLNYTYAQVRSNITYDHDIGAWIGSGIDACTTGELASSDNMCRNVDVELGDIAPHKINLGVNIPLTEALNINIRANHVSQRTLYLANALRAEDIKASSYTLVNANIGYEFSHFRLDFVINNLFDEEYYHPGMQSANSGDAPLDAQGNLARYDNGNLVKSKGFQSSLLPQLKRNYSLILSASF